MDINIFFARIRPALATVGPSAPTNLLTLLREELNLKVLNVQQLILRVSVLHFV